MANDNNKDGFRIDFIVEWPCGSENENFHSCASRKYDQISTSWWANNEIFRKSFKTGKQNDQILDLPLHAMKVEFD